MRYIGVSLNYDKLRYIRYVRFCYTNKANY